MNDEDLAIFALEAAVLYGSYRAWQSMSEQERIELIRTVGGDSG